MTRVLAVPESEIEISAVRSAGAGGQNVQKVSSAVQLRFDVRASSLPQGVKERLLALKDHRITREGVLVLKAQQHRTRERNRKDAIERLQALIDSVSVPRTPRRPTAPTRASRKKRLEAKRRRSEVKQLRRRVRAD